MEITSATVFMVIIKHGGGIDSQSWQRFYQNGSVINDFEVYNN